MSGYLRGMTYTGNAAIDGILEALEGAGDTFHHTSEWSEDPCGDGSPLSKIEAAATKAADQLTAVQARVAELEATLALARELAEGARTGGVRWAIPKLRKLLSGDKEGL